MTRRRRRHRAAGPPPEWWPKDEQWPPRLWQPQKRRRRWIWRALAGLACVLVAGGVFAWWQIKETLDDFQEGYKAPIVEEARPELDVEPRKKLPGLRDATTFLLIGSDIRPDAAESWGRSDTIILARIYPEDKAVSLLSIPRDLRVSIPGHGTDKVNAAYSYGGPSLLIETLREYLGVPINHFFQIDFAGFEQLAGELDELYLPIDQRYFHSNEGLDPSQYFMEIDLRPGYQALEPSEALSFVRHRHSDSDFLRGARQQLFLREVGRQVAKIKSRPLDLRKLAQATAKAAISDLDSVTETLKLANTLRQIPADRIARVTLEADSYMSGGVYYLAASPEQKAEALKLWTNPEELFAAQESRPPAKGATARGLRALLGLRRISAPLDPELAHWLARERARLESIDAERRARRLSKKMAKRTERNARLVPDGGEGAALTGQRRGMRHCRPTALPEGYHWPEREEGRNAYKLAGHQALAVYATAGSGRSVLWTWTTWPDPPILDEPTDAIEIQGKRYELYWESGKLRMISWREGKTRGWITNTLANELTPEQMIALARTCKR